MNLSLNTSSRYYTEPLTSPQKQTGAPVSTGRQLCALHRWKHLPVGVTPDREDASPRHPAHRHTESTRTGQKSRRMSVSSPEQADHASIPQGRVHQLLVLWLKNTQIWNVIRLKGCYSPSDWTASASVSVEKILLGRYKAGSDAILLSTNYHP